MYSWGLRREIQPTGNGHRLRLFRKVCGGRGSRITSQRRQVFREVAGTDEHPDADAILRRVCKRVPKISLDTVSRILCRLEDEGLISRVQMSAGRADDGPQDH